MPLDPLPSRAVRHGRCSRRCGIAGLAIGLGLLAACRRAEPPPGPRVVVHRLADELAAAAGARESAAEAVGNVTRYVLRATPTGQLFPPAGVTAVHTDHTGSVEVPLACPPGLAGTPMVVKIAVLDRSWLADGTLTCTANDSAPRPYRVAGLAPDADTLPWLVGYGGAPPPAVVTDWSQPVPDAVLRVALGIADIVPPERTAPVRFTVRAEDRDGRAETVLSRTLDPAARPADREWVEVEAPLRWLGPELRLHFDAESLRPDVPTFPLWGDPTIVAPRAADAVLPANVLLVSIDTVRADRLSSYGFPAPTSPGLDHLADQGVLFETAIAQANWTLPSHATMLTGAYPCAFDIGGAHGPKPMPTGVTPLAEVLRRRGYATAAFTEDAYVNPTTFQRGFDLFRADSAWLADPTGETIQRTVGGARRWLEAHLDDPFFLFVHTYQVHAPYDPPPGYRELVGVPAPPVPYRFAVDAADYAAELRYADDVLGTLLGLLDQRQLSGHTIVLVTSDHGEAFGEHGREGHGWNLFEEELHVPMIWRAPGLIPAGHRVSALVGLVDVVPTILDLLGLPAPDDVRGTSLVPLLRGDQAALIAARDRILYAQNPIFGQEAVRGFAWKALFASGEPDVFHLPFDPGEVAPDRDRGMVFLAKHFRVEIEEACRQARIANGVAKAPAPVIPPDETQQRKLRALGYVQ